MPLIPFTPADVLKSVMLPDAWYKAQIVKIGDWKQSTKGSTMNLIITFLIEETEGKEVEFMVNSSMKEKLLPLASAAMQKEFTPEKFNLDTDELKDKQLDVKVVKGEYKGNIKNEIVDFLPYGKSANEANPY